MSKYAQGAALEFRGGLKAWHLALGGALLLLVLKLRHLMPTPIGPVPFWREALTNMVAQNLADGSATMLVPTVNHIDPHDGRFAMEFPIFSYLISLLIEGFGFAHRHGRLLTFGSYLLGLASFWGILASGGRPVRERVYAVAALSLSCWFVFSAVSIPDPFAIGMVLTGTYLFASYLASGGASGWRVLVGVLLVSLGVGAKLPAVMLLALLVPIWWRASVKNRWVIAVAVAVAGIAPALWYYVHLPDMLASGAHPLMYPESLKTGFEQVFSIFWDDTQRQFTKHLFAGNVLIVASALGFFLALVRGQRYWSSIGLLSLLLLTVLALRAGWTFSTHQYYLLPFAPVAAGLVGFFLARLPVPAALVIFSISLVQTKHYDIKFDHKQPVELLTVKATVDRLDPTGGPIYLTSGLDPRHAYFAERKGWAGRREALSNIDYMRAVYREGGRLLIHPWTEPDELSIPFREIHRDRTGVYYRLTPSGN